MTARRTALAALIACRKQGAWSDGILKEYLARDELDRRDAALASRLCYGVLQNRMLLDYYLQQVLTGRLKDLQPVVLDILRLGAYQILLLDKIPAAAAVNESVNSAKSTPTTGQRGSSTACYARWTGKRSGLRCRRTCRRAIPIRRRLWP